MKVRANVIENTTYHEDFEFAFGYNRWLLKVLVIWPDFQNSMLKVCSSIVRVFYCCLVSGTVSIQFSTTYYKRDEFGIFMEMIGLLNIYIVTFIKYIILTTHIKTIQACIRQMESDWRYMFENSREVMLQYARISRVFLLITTSVWMGVVVCWHSTVWLTEARVVDNVTLYVLPYNTYFETFNAEAAPFFFYIDGVYFLCDTFLSLMSCNICLIITVVMHVCGQYVILQSIVHTFSDEKLSDRQLKICIARFLKKHVCLLR